MDFLIEESKARKATIVVRRPSSPLPLFPSPSSLPLTTCLLSQYATHIYDGLTPFPTKVLHMQLGRTPKPALEWDPEAAAAPGGKSLLTIALGWLKEDRTLRKQREKEAGGKTRGPQKEVSRRARCVLESRRLVDATLPIPFTDKRRQEFLRKI